MASPAHCAYCIDVLASHLAGRAPISLDETISSWRAYVAATASEPVAKGIPTLRRLALDSASSLSTTTTITTTTTTTPTPTPTPSDVSTPLTSTSSILNTAATAIAPPTAQYPLFVTWSTRVNHGIGSSSDDDDDDDDDEPGLRLRGCIGTFEPHTLAEGLSEFSLTSALEDTRFPPISEQELPALQCSITLLTDFEDAADVMDWTIGEHGLRISFTHHGQRYGATYLPDVAPAQGWTKEETLVSLMRKAGWMGSRSRWRDVAIKVVRYKGKKASLAYQEYEKWMAWRAQ